MDSQQVFLVPQVPPLPSTSSSSSSSTKSPHHQQQQTTTQMLQQQPLQTPQCSICGTTQKLLRCAKCKAIYYCSTDHQHLDWPTHKQECRTLAKQRQHNNRLQQLTNGCGAININAHSNSSNNPNVANITNNWSSYDYPQPQQQNFKSLSHESTAFVLGTHENEILNSKAESVTQNSNSSEYMGNIEANSTTTDQMHNIMLPNNFVNNTYSPNNTNQTFTDNSYYYQTNPSHLDNNLLEQTEQNHLKLANSYVPASMLQQQHQPVQNNLQHQQSLQQQSQQQVYLPVTTTSNTATPQYPVPQLSNHLINQHEKSSSYQIGAAVVDENLFENAK